jgi:queuine tRNA-ribosyltransferase
MLASTLCTIHNERFVVRLVDDIRASIEAGTFFDFKLDFLGRYYGERDREARSRSESPAFARESRL